MLWAYSHDHTLIDERDLEVERVSDYISHPNDVYNVMLLPLKEQRTATDPNGQFRDEIEANKVALDALLGVRLYSPDDSGESYQRFNCGALDGWTWQKINEKLEDLGLTDSSPETAFAALATRAEYVNDEGRPIELGFFGDIIEDANSIEIILKVIDVDVKESRVLFHRIDIFSRKPNYKWCTDALISKLHRTIPRIRAGITCGDPKSKKVTVSLGRNAGVFQNMDVGLYKEENDGSLKPLDFRAGITDVRRESSEIHIASKLQWNNVCNIIGGKTVAVSR
jgi:hypothetical protein